MNIKRKLTNTILKVRSKLKLNKVNESKGIHDAGLIGFATVKDEIHIIEKTLNHYRKIGCNAFVIVDNMSTDGTFEYLSQQQDVTLYTTNEPFKSITSSLSSKQRWMTILLNKYGKGKWCIGFDADELFIYPKFEYQTLKDTINYLEQNNYDSIKCLWIDMYSLLPIKETTFNAPNLIEDCKFFDRNCRNATATTRVFGWRSEFDKTPLFKWSSNIAIETGWHRLGGSPKIADFEGAVLHFPFNEKLLKKSELCVRNGNYFDGSKKYQVFLNALKENNNLSLMDNDSIEFKGSNFLYNEGYLQLSEVARQVLLDD